MNRIVHLRNLYDRYGPIGLVQEAARRPKRLVEVVRGNTNHFYTLENTVYWEDIVTIVPQVVDCSQDEAVAVWEEIRGDTRVEQELTAGLRRTGERPDGLHSNWREFLYVLVRLTEPTCVVETGIYDGLSATYILAALRKNGCGELISIDINNQERLPSDIENVDAGWLVPPYLQGAWTRKFGDAKELLPTVLETETPDVFIHDSLHTAEHMRFEFETATEFMEPGGFLVTDNCRFNNVFRAYVESSFASVAFWPNTEYALSPSKERVDDRFGIGVLQ
ncbi:class I SAM-dependent methyltransferase [Halosegnis marinus]|uniref:Class I SAM-dependent methyltransferase n=1 Tax=Halosegnis marinus TaxID=3034023 RepID=A0ABD5ZPN8_9EURY|nr:class I SAM-dependent methyltransferase [Halosegnis sp. DT85]